MTDFYAYFKLTGTITDRVGAVSAEAARGTDPDPFDVIAHVKHPHGAYPRVHGVTVQLVDVMPHFQAEEFAKHAFMERPEARAERRDRDRRPFWCTPPSTSHRLSGHQYLWEVDTLVFVRFGFVIAAPTRELAAARAEETRAYVEDVGFDALKLNEAEYAKAEVSDVRTWVPAEFAGRLQGLAR